MTTEYALDTGSFFHQLSGFNDDFLQHCVMSVSFVDITDSFVQGYYGILLLDQSSKGSFEIFSTITADNATTLAEKSLIHIWPISEPISDSQKHAK